MPIFFALKRTLGLDYHARVGAATNTTLHKLVKELRTTFARLDTRVDNLRDDLPALATRYEQARETLQSIRIRPTVARGETAAGR